MSTPDKLFLFLEAIEIINNFNDTIESQDYSTTPHYSPDYDHQMFFLSISNNNDFSITFLDHIIYDSLDESTNYIHSSQQLQQYLLEQIIASSNTTTFKLATLFNKYLKQPPNNNSIPFSPS